MSAFFSALFAAIKSIPQLLALVERVADAIEKTNEQRARIRQEQLELDAGRLRVQMELAKSDIERQAINKQVIDIERRFSK